MRCSRKILYFFCRYVIRIHFSNETNFIQFGAVNCSLHRGYVGRWVFSLFKRVCVCHLFFPFDIVPKFAMPHTIGCVVNLAEIYVTFFVFAFFSAVLFAEKCMSLYGMRSWTLHIRKWVLYWCLWWLKNFVGFGEKADFQLIFKFS